MALSDLAVFGEQLYSTTTEVLTEQVDLFNDATRGAIILSSRPFSGDFSDTAFFAKVQGLVRRRDPYATGAIARKSLQHVIDTMVKVGAGTAELDISKAQFRWIQQNPEVAAATFAQQLAKDTMQDMLGLAIGATRAALATEAEVYHDGTAGVISHRVMNRATSKFGDYANEIVVWVMHSTPLFDLYDNALANGEALFNYGTVNIASDPFGRIFVISDNGSLRTAGVSPAPDTFHTLGLVPGAVVVNMNDDYDSNVDERNGDENIVRTFQGEWSYNLGVKGFSWDKVNGGKAPQDAAILTGTNWDRYATSHKDLPGVLLNTQ